MEPAIDMVAVTKRFGSTTALDGLDLSVAVGEVHGFLGPNGAGKTTALRVLLGTVRMDGGSARVLGRDPWSQAADVHGQLAYVPGDVALWPSLTGTEVITLLGQLQGSLDPQRRDELCERLALDPSRKCRTYSKGNRQKVALIAALSTRAELLLLDEPTSGLDPIMEDAFRQCVRERREQGCTVLLSSHLLNEVEALADRVTLIREGHVVETGSIADLRHLRRTAVTAVVNVVPPGLDAMPGVHDVQVSDQQVIASVDQVALGAFMEVLSAAGIRALTCQPPSLEDVFLRHYGVASDAESDG